MTDTKIRIPPKVRRVMDKFIKAGGQIYIVGGATRDLLLGRRVKDWDFTTNLTPEEMKALFPKHSFYNNNFGTFSIILRGGEVFEVTTFRTEKGYSDKRHPDKVTWGKTLEEDLQRRDFTINAIAYDLKDFYDPFGGKKDLKRKLIKAVGDADTRFKEDALRLIRAVRIASQLGFKIETKTKQAIKRNAKRINDVAGERIREELFKILLSPIPSRGIEMLRETGILKEIMPELMEGLGMAQKGHHIYDVWEHGLKALDNCLSEDPVTRLACLLHDVAKPVVARGKGEERTFHNHEVVGSRMATAIGKRLKFSRKQLDMLFKLVRWHMFSTGEKQTDKSIRRFIRRVTPEYIDEMIALRRADRLGSGAKETSWRWELFKKRIVEVQKQPFTVKDLKVNGEDVMRELGIKPGPKVGQILDHLFKQVEEEPELNKREVLLAKIRQEKV